MARFSAIVFDMDSTLVDSREHILKYGRDMLDFMGKPFPEDKRELFYTLDKDSLDQALFAAEEIAIANEFRRLNPYMDRLGEIVALPAADSMLARLAERQLRLGILTNRGSSTPPLLRQLGWQDYFAPVLSADILQRPKPDPMGLLQIAEHWQTSPHQILFVGDSQIDAACAQAAGARFVQITAVSPPLPNQTSFANLAALADWLLLHD